MPPWKNYEAAIGTHTVLRRTAFAAMLLVSCLCSADSSAITIGKVSGTIDKNIYSVNAQISYQLSNEMREALDHGVPLEFEIEVQLLEQRPWIWDKLVSMQRIIDRVEHQPLSGHYLVTRQPSANRHQFQDLDGVLRFMGEIKNLPLIKAEQLIPNAGLYARIKTRLNIAALPAPLRPLAYFSSQWRLASPWQTWTVKP